jgi:NAD(P)H-nitrite reductase large subunit
MASASKATHFVIVGTGPAGDEAVAEVRRRDTEARITMVSAGKLPYIRRCDLYRVFEGVEDWRELLVHPPDYFVDQRITLRRNSVVVSVDTQQRLLGLKHKEEIHYDKLLIAGGGGGYLPEYLRDYRHLVHRFDSFEDALRLRRSLPPEGHVTIIGGDMMGIDVARRLLVNGFEVTLVAGDQLFSPHKVEVQERPRLIEAIEGMGAVVVTGRAISAIEQGAAGMSARRVVLDDGEGFNSDAVLAFCGLMPSLGYLAGAGLPVQRGLLVDPKLATANDSIWGAGDVCQIWFPQEKRYRYSFAWKSVEAMGRVAAANMCGESKEFDVGSEGYLRVNPDNNLESSYWEYE